MSDEVDRGGATRTRTFRAAVYSCTVGYIYIVYIKHRVSNHLAGFCFKTSYMVFSLSFFYRSRPEKKEQKELNYEKRPRHSTDMKKQMKKQKRPESK